MPKQIHCNETGCLYHTDSKRVMAIHMSKTHGKRSVKYVSVSEKKAKVVPAITGANFCPVCGGNVRGTMNFCAACGTYLAQVHKLIVKLLGGGK